MDPVYWLNGIIKWSPQLGSLIICISMAELIKFGQGSLNLTNRKRRHLLCTLNVNKKVSVDHKHIQVST